MRRFPLNPVYVCTNVFFISGLKLESVHYIYTGVTGYSFQIKLKKIVGSNNFSAQFIKIISHYKKIGYNINVLQQTACLVVNPITVGNFAFLFNCTPVGRTSDSMMVPT